MRQDEYRKICKLSHSVFLYRSSDTSHQYTWETEEQPTKSGNLDWFLTKIHKNFISSYVTPEERSFSKKNCYYTKNSFLSCKFINYFN